MICFSSVLTISSYSRYDTLRRHSITNEVFFPRIFHLNLIIKKFSGKSKIRATLQTLAQTEKNINDTIQRGWQFFYIKGY